MMDSLPSSTDVNQAGESERRRLLRDLVRHGGDEAVAVVAEALAESHWPVCDELADALAMIGTEAAREALVAALKARRHHIRSAAVKALVRLGGPGVRQAIERLREDPSYEVRQDVAEALAGLE